MTKEEEAFEMEISRSAMKIARAVPAKKISEMNQAIEEIAKDFNKPSSYVESRLQELVHENIIQTIRELV